MWTVERIESYLQKLSNNTNDTFNIPVSINGRLTSTLGRVVYSLNKLTGYCENKKMEFSRNFLESETDDVIESVIQHEWCHYYLTKVTHEKHGHDKAFKELCRRIGCANDKTFLTLETTPTSTKYEVFCETCNTTVAQYKRMCKTLENLDKCTCKVCGTSKLKLIQNW